MRDAQARLIHDLVVVDEYVEVHGSRPPAHAAPHAAGRLLDAEQHVEQLAGGERGLDGRRPVQEERLVDEPDRVGLAEGRHGRDLDSRLFREQLDRPAERRLPVSEIRSESYVCPRHRLRAQALDDHGGVLDRRVEDDETDQFDGHAIAFPSTAAAIASASTVSRTSWTRSIDAPCSNAATAAPSDAGIVPTVAVGSPRISPSELFRENPTSTGRPRATSASRRRTSSRFCSTALPK